MDCSGPCTSHITPIKPLKPAPCVWSGRSVAFAETGHFLSGPICSEQIANQKNAWNNGKSKKVLKKTQNRNTQPLHIGNCFVYLNNNLPETVGWLCLRKKSGKFFNRQSAKVLTLRLMPDARYSDFGFHAIRAWAFCANMVSGLPEPLRCMNHKNPRFPFSGK